MLLCPKLKWSMRCPFLSASLQTAAAGFHGSKVAHSNLNVLAAFAMTQIQYKKPHVSRSLLPDLKYYSLWKRQNSTFMAPKQLTQTRGYKSWSRRRWLKITCPRFMFLALRLLLSQIFIDAWYNFVKTSIKPKKAAKCLFLPWLKCSSRRRMSPALRPPLS